MRGLALGGWNSTEGNGVASRVEIEGVAAAGGAARWDPSGADIDDMLVVEWLGRSGIDEIVDEPEAGSEVGGVGVTPMRMRNIG